MIVDMDLQAQRPQNGFHSEPCDVLQLFRRHDIPLSKPIFNKMDQDRRHTERHKGNQLKRFGIAMPEIASF